MSHATRLPAQQAEKAARAMEEEYDDTYYAPTMSSNGESRTLSFQTRILNQHLICTL